MWDHYPSEWSSEKKETLRSFINYATANDPEALELLEEYFKELLDEASFYAMQWAVHGDGQMSLD